MTDKPTETTKPLSERITQGTAKIEAMGNLWGGGLKIADMDPQQADCYRKALIAEREANIFLMQESFNVTHETGRTPRQLADERAELIALLKTLPGCFHREDERGRCLCSECEFRRKANTLIEKFK